MQQDENDVSRKCCDRCNETKNHKGLTGGECDHRASQIQMNCYLEIHFSKPSRQEN